MMTRKSFLTGAAASAITGSASAALTGESIEGGWGRARGLIGGAFMGTLLAQQGGGPAPVPYHGYVADGLVAYWDGIDNTGGGDEAHDINASTWHDLAGSNNLSVIGSGGWSSAAFTLQGTNAHYATGTLDFDISTAFTIEFTGTVLGVDGSGRFWGWNLSNGNQNYCDVGLRNYDATRLFNFSGLGFTATGASLSAVNPTTGALLTSTIARSDGRSVIYSNGASVYNAGSVALSSNRNSVFTIGGGHNGKYGAMANVNSVRIYSRALTASEIAANHTLDVQRFGTT